MLLSSIDIFNQAGQVFKANYLAFWKITAWMLVPGVFMAASDYLFSKLGYSFASYSVPLDLALVAVLVVLGLWIQIVVTRLVFNAYKQVPVDTKIVRREAWRDTISYVWVMILVQAALLLGLIFFVVPGILFAVWFSFAGLIFILEGVRGRQALMKSKELVKGRFWAVVWRWLILHLIYLLILIVVAGVPTLLIGWATKFAGFSVQAGPWWFNLVQVAGTAVILPLQAAFGVVFYSALKEAPLVKN